ncbi:hypothetical protein OSG_eHP23_00040 [environmental Halophage eHP-23]|nr:hypothetical protein OSG_eHP23_00040 [environmental Halophage eHP-23]
MVNPLNDAGDLENRLGFLGPNQEKFELEERLQDATLELDTMVGREVEEQLRPENEDQRKFSFAFSNIFELHKVIIQSNVYEFEKKVDDTNYTVTKDPDRASPVNIEFTQSFAEEELLNNDYRLRVLYIPELFKRLELRLAELDITTLSSIQTGDDERQAQAEKARQRVQSIRDRINRTTQNLGDKDAGDSLASNYNYPGNR